MELKTKFILGTIAVLLIGLGIGGWIYLGHENENSKTQTFTSWLTEREEPTIEETQLTAIKTELETAEETGTPINSAGLTRNNPAINALVEQHKLEAKETYNEYLTSLEQLKTDKSTDTTRYLTAIAEETTNKEIIAKIPTELIEAKPIIEEPTEEVIP